MTDSKKPLDRNESVCTTREAAVRLGVSLRTAQLWVDAGLLEAWKTEGGHRRISIASVDRMSKGKQAPAPEPFATPANDERLRVLVVEDDNVLLKLYRLRIAGWNLPIVISTAANGYEALVLIGREQPDLLICDLGMPGMDGFQMVQTLCKSSFREGMEIVVVTGMKDEEIADKGVLPSDVHVLHKPVPFAELKSIAESLLNRRAELG
jgi:excisionase family DNA binding protein